MAKICFYCGRELLGSEKCSCRGVKAAASDTTQTARAERQTSGNGATGASTSTRAGGSRAQQNTAHGTRSTDGSGPRTKTGSGFFQKIKDAYRNFSSNFTRPSQTARPVRSTKLQTLRDQIRILFPTFSIVIKNFLEYIIHPVTRIQRESIKSKRNSSFLIIILFSLLSGFLGMLFIQSGSPLFASVMLLTLGQDTSLLFIHPILSMVGFSVLTLVLILIMAICFFIGAWLTKHPAPFRKVLDTLSISFIYPIIIESVLLLGMFLGSRGSITMILFSFLLMSITQYISFRNALYLKEDTAFLLLIFVYSSCYIIYLSIIDSVSLVLERI